MRLKPGPMAVTLRRRALNLERAVRAAEKEAAEEGLEIARSLSEGKYSSARLAQLGHPYAKRKPNPPQDPAIINRQKGAGGFADQWRVSGPRKTKGGLTTRLVNDAPYSGFLARGTKWMIRRPTRERVMLRLKPMRARILRKHLKDALG